MKRFRLATMLAAGLLLAPGHPFAQELSGSQVVRTLGRLQGGAPAIDLALLMEEAAASAGKGVAALPDWQKLSKLSQLIVEIDFENDSIAIEPKSYRTVGMIADALHHPNLRRYKFLVVGHTSSTGDAKHNLDLSQKRANAITEALSTTFAIAPDRLFAIGVGEEWLVDPSNPQAADNRRVQLVNLGLVK
ncbi:OmpA family protein [Rhizobium leguminosarum]|uniref:OmpA family protein n=1 Tax=Rhizobium leguminosarum TaxID=384 RepID=UPI001C927F17|nr:OmpA family protein [Rhizobium leguminosarum]MBY3174644.1 OmpA family protein [Rhizobium leguminosarum]MBY5588027.1 OmpA family protein [Rhizobium leguminosarum]MBY5600479.1 OmpA family protein [Rhizobium leguminosarum]MBY5641186.1 OmpA family protein [Rhizobium leguminosarum]MBY5667306.1 OmpA family protein [Rhizobium leguminosarum]